MERLQRTRASSQRSQPSQGYYPLEPDIPSRILLTPSLILFCALLFLSGCQPVTADEELSGRITLWHSWTGQEAAELSIVLDQFQEIHPNVRIVEVALPQDQILDEFKAAAQNGLAPGVIIGENRWMRELVQLDLIRSFAETEATSTLTNARNKALVDFEGQPYGVPLSLAPRALYLNRDLVDAPPRTLDELLQEANSGNRVEFVPRFEEAYWGIQAFGEGLFGDDGRLTLADSGFEQWLAWLDGAQNAQGVILNVDDESLLDLFASGQIAYYISGPESLQAVSERMDPDNPFELGIAALPAGPQGPAGPLLNAETIMSYAYTSPEQARIADALAAFLINERQGIRFMRELDMAPANPRIAVDRRVYPIVSGFAQQARTSVVMPNEISIEPLTVAGNRAYTSVLSGGATPAEAVCQFAKDVVGLNLFLPEEIDVPDGCEIFEN